MRCLKCKSKAAYTLIEVVVVVSIYAIISFALSIALEAMVKSQRAASSRDGRSEKVRAVFDIMRRDLEATQPLKFAKYGIFLGNSSSGSGASAAIHGALMAFNASDIERGPAGANSSQEQRPSSSFGVAMIRYDLTQNGALTRTVGSRPDVQSIIQVANGPESLLLEGLVDLKLRFYDSSTGQWRNSWTFHTGEQIAERNSQKKQSQAQVGEVDEVQLDSSLSGDRLLPSQVEVNLTMHDGDALVSYTIIIPIGAYEPADISQQLVEKGIKSVGGAGTSPGNPKDTNPGGVGNGSGSGGAGGLTGGKGGSQGGDGGTTFTPGGG